MKARLLLLCLIAASKSYTQNLILEPLSIGDKVPNDIWATIPKKSETKLVILDFWATTCGTCIAAFPKMEKLQRQFENSLQIVLVNKYETEEAIKIKLEKINRNRVKSKFILMPNLPAINGDTIWSKLFPHASLPHHVWIDNEGSVLAISEGYNATPEAVTSFLNGKKLDFSIKDDNSGQEIINNGILQPTIGLAPVVYYSGFMKYFSIRYALHEYIDSVKDIYRMSLYNRDVFDLFTYAFRVPYKRERVIFEISESEKYKWPKDDNLIDEWKNKYCFTYEIQVQLKEKGRWKETMRQDVNRFFGNLFSIEARVEKREYKSLVLVMIEGGKIKISGGKKAFNHKDSLLSWINYPFRNVVSSLYELEDMSAGRPFLDETGFTGNVDMQLVGNLSSLKNVKTQLNRYGLDIIEANREVEVLVIKDRRAGNSKSLSSALLKRGYLHNLN